MGGGWGIEAVGGGWGRAGVVGVVVVARRSCWGWGLGRVEVGRFVMVVDSGGVLKKRRWMGFDTVVDVEGDALHGVKSLG